MPVARHIKESLERPSWIRRMFEEGAKLKAQFGADKVFDFSLGNPDVEPPDGFREVVKALLDDQAPGMHGYMPNPGYPHVRAAVAKKASREQGVELGAGNVIMTVGAAGGLNVILRTIVDPGDEIIAVRPYFAEYIFYAQNCQASFVPVPSGPGYSLSVENIRAALTPRTAAVIINSPNNPTGVIYSRQNLADLAAALTEHGTRCGRMPYIVADEPYREIVYNGAEVPPVMSTYPDTIVASSWSKTLSLPGERIGYIAISPRCADTKELFDGMAMCTRTLGFVNAPALMQRTVAELLERKADVGSYARRGKLLSDGLRAAGYTFPEPAGAFYIFADAPKLSGDGDQEGLDVAFCTHLKKYNILAVPGVGFGWPGAFRLSYCVSERTIRDSLPAFAKAMEDWKAGN